jgi:hypothetical protein
MPDLQRMRETISELPTPDQLRAKQQEGWRPFAIEWRRDTDHPSTASLIAVPYGLRVADDCIHLEEDPEEKHTLMLIMDLIVDDKPLSDIAAALNQRGLRTRLSTSWTPAAIFNLLPRTVEAGPRIFSSETWIELRQAR